MIEPTYSTLSGGGVLETVTYQDRIWIVVTSLLRALQIKADASHFVDDQTESQLLAIRKGTRGRPDRVVVPLSEVDGLLRRAGVEAAKRQALAAHFEDVVLPERTEGPTDTAAKQNPNTVFAKIAELYEALAEQYRLMGEALESSPLPTQRRNPTVNTELREKTIKLIELHGHTHWDSTEFGFQDVALVLKKISTVEGSTIDLTRIAHDKGVQLGSLSLKEKINWVDAIGHLQRFYDAARIATYTQTYSHNGRAHSANHG